METVTLEGSTPSFETSDSGLCVWRVVLVCCLYLPLAVVTVVGNLLVLAAYRRDEKIRRKKTNTYILNLAIADLLVGIVMFINAPKYVTEKWYFGREFCVLVWAVDFISTDMSVITIIAISVDRYLMVRDTLRHGMKQSTRRIMLIFTILWVICSFCHTCLAYVYSVLNDYKYLPPYTCNLEYRREKALVILMFLIEFLLPVAFLLFLNTKVFLHIYRKGSRIQLRNGKRCKKETIGTEKIKYVRKSPDVRLQTGDEADPESPFETQEGLASASQDLSPDATNVRRNSKPRQQSTSNADIDNEIRVYRGSTSSASKPHKAAKLLTAIVTAFIISWLPYYIYDCYVLINGGDANVALSQVLTFVLWSNSAVNPILYACANVHYRDNFKHFLHIK